MEPVLGTTMKASPKLTGLSEWMEGTVIDIEHNPLKGWLSPSKIKRTQFILVK